jgi:hypothetical protein
LRLELVVDAMAYQSNVAEELKKLSHVFECIEDFLSSLKPQLSEE